MTDDGERCYREAEVHLRRGERAAVIDRLRACVEVGDREWASRAGASLGRLLQQLGDLPAARSALELAVALGHPTWSGLAGVELGLVETRLGDLASAAATYRDVASTSTSDEAVANALFNLATLHQQAGEIDAAIDRYRAVFAGPCADLAAEAGVNLGYLLYTAHGDLPGATAAWRAVIASGHPQQSQLARMNLDSIRRAGPSATVVLDESVDVSTGIDTGSGDRVALQIGLVNPSPPSAM